MEDLLTTRQVLEILKVDRITVYRMLQDGRIKGVKIGMQWRFPRKEIERVVGGNLLSPEPVEPERPGNEAASFPTHCVQTIQDLFAEVGRVSALVIDPVGAPLTEVSQPCRYCQIIMQSAGGEAACRASWKEFAQKSSKGSRFFTCHAGIQYISAPIVDREKTVGYFLAGEFYWQAPNSNEQAERTQSLSAALDVSPDTLNQSASTIPVIEPEEHSRVEAWPVASARAVQSILHERGGFIERLQQIADLTKIHKA